jgi:hypothetical protein
MTDRPGQSALRSRHEGLGATLGPCFEMDVPWEYDQDTNLEHYAVRNAVAHVRLTNCVGQSLTLGVVLGFPRVSGPMSADTHPNNPWIPTLLMMGTEYPEYLLFLIHHDFGQCR